VQIAIVTKRTGQANQATVWAAEHGASSPDLGGDEQDDGANVLHRFRIHGRLPAEPDDIEDEPPGGSGPPEVAAPPGYLDPDNLRRFLAEHTEIDLRYVDFSFRNQEIDVTGTVTDEGERRELLALLSRLPEVRAVHDRLRVNNPV
jgi:hypothetical protein